MTRKAVRVTGSGTIVPKKDADPALSDAFEAGWSPYLSYMSAFVAIAISAAELILSPAYDIGLTEAELRDTNLAKLNAL